MSARDSGRHPLPCLEPKGGSLLRSHVEIPLLSDASLFQKPRAAAEDKAFQSALRVMALLYASAVGTCVLIHRKVPPRPRTFDGLLLAFDLPEAITDGELSKIVSGCGGTLSSAEPCGEVGDWELRFASHEEAQRMEAALRTWASKQNARDKLGSPAQITLAYNDRAYEDRGWVTTQRLKLAALSAPYSD